uniref:Uncharacterized protein n=1 Tax=Setaria digitata TaxID=48799 RepID=A0A915Q7G7_9BILA
MKIYVWIISASIAATLVLSLLILCCILILKLPRNRLRTSTRSIIVRPEVAKPINAFEESSRVYARISSASIITLPQYPLQKNGIRGPESRRPSNKKSNWISGPSEQRNGHFVDRDPPSDQSKCDYLDPLDLNLSKLHDIYISGNNYHQSKQTGWPTSSKTTATTHA